MSEFWSDTSCTSTQYVCEQRRLWRVCADAQTRLSLRWSPMCHNLILFFVSLIIVLANFWTFLGCFLNARDGYRCFLMIACPCAKKCRKASQHLLMKFLSVRRKKQSITANDARCDSKILGFWLQYLYNILIRFLPRTSNLKANPTFKQHYSRRTFHKMFIFFSALSIKSGACIKVMSQFVRFWYLSHRRPAKAQASLRIRAVSPEPSLFAHMNCGRRRRVRPKIRHLAPLGGCACAFEKYVYGWRKVR